MSAPLHFATVALVLAACGASAADAVPVAPPAALPGPAVEVTQRDGESYRATLLNFHDGVLDLQTGDGKLWHESIDDLHSLKFVSNLEKPLQKPPPPPAPPFAGYRRGLWSEAEGKRFRELNEKDHGGGALSKIEKEELGKLRERNISFLQSVVKHAENEEDARRALWALSWVYRRKMQPSEIRGALQREVEGIQKPELRKKMTEWLANYEMTHPTKN
ncbi:MAG TPA: hypothetical protein VGP72_18530 [Planctomycetota bacterium]|jgi:hypothetical protein